MIYGTSTQKTSPAQPKVAAISRRKLPKVLTMQVRNHCLLQVHGVQLQSNILFYTSANITFVVLQSLLYQVHHSLKVDQLLILVQLIPLNSQLQITDGLKTRITLLLHTTKDKTGQSTDLLHSKNCGTKQHQPLVSVTHQIY